MSINLTGTNALMRSQLTGATQRTGLTKHIQKEEDIEVRREVRSEPKDVKEQKDKYTPGVDSQQPRVHRKKAEQVIQRFVSETGQNKDAKKAQTKDTEAAKRAQQAGEGEDTQQAKAKVPLDNASRIGLMYQQAVRKKNAQKERVASDNRAAQNQQGRLKNFLGNLRKYVKLEYQQYTKPEISTYSRRNLREILGALGDNVKAFDNKAQKDRRDRIDITDGPKGYNKHYAATASRHLKLFNEDPMQDPNYNPFEMIA